MISRWTLCAALLAALLSSGGARADEAHEMLHLNRELEPRRFEFAGFPIVGGSTDIGVQLGGAARLTRFYEGARPYLWKIDLVLSASAKSDENGFRLVQQSHLLRFDAVELWSGRLRADVLGVFQRSINAGYYGIGNATRALVPTGELNVGRHYQYLLEEGRLRGIARVRVVRGVDVAVGSTLRFVAPQVYSGSKLERDQRDPGVTTYGVGPAAIGGLSTGLILDTRDSEFVTTRGIFYQLGVGVTESTTGTARYGNASVVLSHYAPLAGPLTFASRVFTSFQFGKVPFYDLAQGGTFEPVYMVGGESGVRGVPQGRYAGAIKVVANIELRARFPLFRLFGQRLRPGTTTFLDMGRVWSDYDPSPARDGRHLGLKFGVGGGLFLQWGEAAIVRLDVAYSPDAQVDNPRFPLGIYLSDGLLF